jgi:hypothetical protein
MSLELTVYIFTVTLFAGFVMAKAIWTAGGVPFCDKVTGFGKAMTGVSVDIARSFAGVGVAVPTCVGVFVYVYVGVGFWQSTVELVCSELVICALLTLDWNAAVPADVTVYIHVKLAVLPIARLATAVGTADTSVNPAVLPAASAKPEGATFVRMTDPLFCAVNTTVNCCPTTTIPGSVWNPAAIDGFVDCVGVSVGDGVGVGVFVYVSVKVSVNVSVNVNVPVGGTVVFVPVAVAVGGITVVSVTVGVYVNVLITFVLVGVFVAVFA